MKKTVKIKTVIFCFTLAIFFLQCNSGVKIRGVYSPNDTTSDTLEFTSGSNVRINLDGERLEGTYKITDKTLLISVKGTSRLIVFTIIDEDTISRRLRNDQIFTKQK